MAFTINIAKGIKKVRAKTTPNRVSRLCLGTAIIDDDQLKCRVSLRNDPNYPDYLVVPFTKESFELKGCLRVFDKKKDKKGHNIVTIRDRQTATFFPGVSSRYTTIVEKEVCSGYVIRKDGKLYFDLRETHGKGRNLVNVPTRINEREPLFNSANNEYNKSV